MRIILVLFSLWLLPLLCQAQIVEGYETIQQVKERLESKAMHRIEGLWRFPSDGGIVAIELEEPSSGDYYRMVAVEPQNRALRPGTIMGYITASSKKGVYNAEIFTRLTNNSSELSKSKKFELQLEDNDNRFSLKEQGKKWEVRWWNLFPYMYRRVIHRVGHNPEPMEGCVRFFPEPIPPIEPRYL